MNIETVELENKEYYIIEKISINSNLYYILINVDDKNDLIIRKYVKEEDGEYLVGLDDEKEYYEVMKNYNEGVSNG